MIRSLIVLLIMRFVDSSFYIDYDNDTFSMNGKPFRYVSGSAHYFRMPKQYWRDRLRKIRNCGLNAVSTYVEWNRHEETPGKFNFAGDLNVRKYIEIAREEDLYVILRPGPYICAERDMGGLPYWLATKHPDVKLRTIDRKYTKYVERWMDVLFNQIKDLLYGNGGNIILVQVENEYGSYPSCDYEYTTWLRDLFLSYVQNNAVLFTTDGADVNYLKCGKIPKVYATVDFGAGDDVNRSFQAQRKAEPNGPLVNSEYYAGWLTHWGEKMARVNTSITIGTLKQILDAGANVNVYMFYGGTNFGFTAGADFNEQRAQYQPVITSYDYDAPITESGDLTDKYYALRELIRKYVPRELFLRETAKPFRKSFGEVVLKPTANLLSPVIRSTGKYLSSKFPLTFEDLDQNHGYLLYETEIPVTVELSQLTIQTFNDYANVYLDETLVGALNREYNVNGLLIEKLSKGSKLRILVENLGRINYGSRINERKGILTNVTLSNVTLTNFNMTSYEFKNLSVLNDCFWENREVSDCLSGGGFVFYMAVFRLPEMKGNRLPDTYLDVSNLTKGLVFVNERNLGRYWSLRGPQYSLYVPSVFLKPFPHYNSIIVMDEYINEAYIKLRFVKNSERKSENQSTKFPESSSSNGFGFKRFS